MIVRVATADDFRAYFPQREVPAVWLGLAAVEDDGRVAGMGIVKWDREGRAWGSLDARRPLPGLAMHRAALRALAALRGAGEPVLFAYCNLRVPHAARWLERLGFAPMPHMTTHDDYPVWSRRLADG